MGKIMSRAEFTATIVQMVNELFKGVGITNYHCAAGKHEGIDLFVVCPTQRDSNKEKFFTPALPITDFYNMVGEDASMEDLKQMSCHIAAVFRRYIQDRIKSVEKDMELVNRKHAKDHIVFSLMNKNDQLLSTQPHREYLDFVIAYTWLDVIEDNKIEGFWITKNMQEELGLTEQELYDIAYQNTKKIFPPVVCRYSAVVDDMLSTFKEYLKKNNVDCNTQEVMEELERVRKIQGQFYQDSAWVITSSYKEEGCIEILFEDNLMGLADLVDDSFYFFFDGRDSVTIIPARIVDRQMLEDLKFAGAMLGRNSMPQRFVSSSLYYYSRPGRDVTIV